MNKKKLKRYRLKINPDKGATVDFISQVQNPAIEVGFLKFQNEELRIRPGSSETEQEWISRCIPYEIKNGYEQSQAAAICYSKWNKRNEMAAEGNMDIFGYSTQHFEMCPGAQATFANLILKATGEDTIGMIRSAAQIADNVFRIEKEVIDANSATSKQLEEAMLLVDDFKDLIQEIDELIGEVNDVSYMDGHIETIKKYLTEENLGYHPDDEDFAKVGPRGAIVESPKAPKSTTPNRSPEGEGSAGGKATGKRGAVVSAEQEKTLTNKAKDFNDKESNTKFGRASVSALKSVFQRGLGAFNVSHSPRVQSAEQWAYARVNAFLYLLKNGRPQNPKYVNDNDLLPNNHPKYSEKMSDKLQSYSDYPKAAKENAARGIRLNKEIGNKCATQVGKVRAQQIADGEPLSKETITRTFSYLSRAKAYYKPSDNKACGTISYLLWGGDEMLRWAESKMNNEDFIKAKMQSELLEDKQELFGPVLIPDLPIYRNSEQMGEYEIIFKKEDIKQIAMNFMKSGYQNNINLDHGDKMADSYVFESFISDEMMPNPKPYEDLPLGTWFVRMKVEDPKVWQSIKEGKRTGFSIEGIFEYMVEEFEKSFKEEKQTTNILSEQEKLNLEKMIKDLFKRIFTELSQELDEKAQNLSDYKKVASSDYKIEARQVGQKVEMVDAMGNLMPAPDGAYEFEDGFKFEVKDGMISSIDGTEEEPMSEETVETEEQIQEEAGMKDKKKAYMDMLADYPWDQCIMDMKDQGYSEEVANKICGSIRWKNMEEEKMAAIEKQKEIEDLKIELAKLAEMVITKEELEKQVVEIKQEFKMIFEKFSQVPAEPSKVNKSALAKDIERQKFEQFINTIRNRKK